MNALLTVLALALSAGVVFVAPHDGPAALIVCGVAALLTGLIISRVQGVGGFLVQIFVAALLVRVAVGIAIYLLRLQDFFGGDAITYDTLGAALSSNWQSQFSDPGFDQTFGPYLKRNWGMPYMVAGLYTVVGRNPLAVQFFNAVAGAATAPLIYLCARHIFSNARVARVAAIFVAFYPSLVLWSSQGLKDGLIVFLLALTMLATLRLGERMSAKQFAILVASLFCLLTLRFYIFYMTLVAVVGAFLIGMYPSTARRFARQFLIVVAMGLALTYMGVLRAAGTQLEIYGDLERVQISRLDQARSAQSGFGKDVDVSTTAGAISVIPVGMLYLLFAPFPWQLANLRQSITLPEMLVWWGSFPLLVTGVWFTLKFRLRQALPILLFTTMLTLGYSIFQGNVGTAYRQRSQLLVFYFIFVAVGVVLMKERREERLRRRRELVLAERAAIAARRGPRRALGQALESPDASAGWTHPATGERTPAGGGLQPENFY